MKFLTTSILVLATTQLIAQDLVYKPRNPNFGGDTFNYAWLLSSAESQNLLKDDAAPQTQKTELERFIDNLNTQLLNQVSRSLFTQQFGTEGISEGTYTFGTLAIDVYPSQGGLTINILDTTTGEQTQVIIPQ
ncbi:curli assembly protein CsgF [Flavobacterium sp. NST-5]|uniref:Curli production assembly/transport component CsgF n=1 Tax=Flavobacterium ichthyis TaxID=2698827 RepID=A0ABW9Z8N8_9FLAO|nr:curli production assembly/transport component CsgF [Flavobacterium ichthyis]NBL65245.1 curli assembly protein CsgF [Flavobacterium ichthyis]